MQNVSTKLILNLKLGVHYRELWKLFWGLKKVSYANLNGLSSTLATDPLNRDSRSCIPATLSNTRFGKRLLGPLYRVRTCCSSNRHLYYFARLLYSDILYTIASLASFLTENLIKFNFRLYKISKCNIFINQQKKSNWM